MPRLLPVNGVLPIIDSSTWIAQDVTITGDVHIGKDCSVWFQTVIRGDCNKIRIGDRVNIQDGTIVHGTTGRGDTIIGNDVSIGHRAIIHGCQIEDRVLIGMGAIVLDDVIVPSGTIIAAGALVNSSAKLESGFIYAGTPAKKLKPITPELAALYIDGTAKAYMKYREWYM